MSKKSVLLKNKERMSRADAAAFLRQLAEKLESGKIHLAQGTREVVMDLPAELVLEVKVDDKPRRRMGTKRSLELELEWYTGEDAEPRADLELK
ncbi:MAG: amphi-Trp domain-containing protein [Anaerolineales bacterium]|nr:amphi-Trp domain-containing protein [Anaerolineales bacterium]